MKKFSNKSSLIIESLRPQEKQETPQINEELVSHISDEVKKRIIIEQAYIEEQRFRKLKDFLGGLFTSGKVDDAADTTEAAAKAAAKEAAEKAAKEKAAKEAAAKAEADRLAAAAGDAGDAAKDPIDLSRISTRVDNKAAGVADSNRAAADGSGDVLDMLNRGEIEKRKSVMQNVLQGGATAVDAIRRGADVAIEKGKQVGGVAGTGLKLAGKGAKGYMDIHVGPAPGRGTIFSRPPRLDPKTGEVIKPAQRFKEEGKKALVRAGTIGTASDVLSTISGGYVDPLVAANYSTYGFAGVKPGTPTILNTVGDYMDRQTGEGKDFIPTRGELSAIKDRVLGPFTLTRPFLLGKAAQISAGEGPELAYQRDDYIGDATHRAASLLGLGDKTKNLEGKPGAFGDTPGGGKSYHSRSSFNREFEEGGKFYNPALDNKTPEEKEEYLDKQWAKYKSLVPGEAQ